MAPQISDDEIDDLLYFARTGDKDELTTLISSLAEREKVPPAGILAGAKDEGKSTCLHMATGNGHLGESFFLLDHFAPAPKEEKQAFLDAPNEYGNTGLHWAALGGHLDVVKLLIDNGASPALANDKNYIPLDLASFGEKIEVIDYFLAQVREMEDENADGDEGEALSGAVEGVQLEDDEVVKEKPGTGKEAAAEKN
ncbi:ankyrin [Trichocladium antarcticum]|uniref:Ankyrin n=1 Tax=Trichocladium antarcticum TaxID=1450529 RepID=A0AAN6URI0_9PEZI|nr:ankyrin [Trichocladium antarcticum]